ncbi:MAG: T9SS type A sorting domain-containing protein [Flexibacteraceae bacterium]
MKTVLKKFGIITCLALMAGSAYAQRDTTIVFPPNPNDSGTVTPPPPPPPPRDTTRPNTGISSVNGFVYVQGVGRVERVINARVQAIRLGLNENFMVTVETDTLGMFNFRQLPAGQYIFRASLNRVHPLFSAVLPTYQGGSIHWSRAWSLTIPMRYDTSLYLYLARRPMRSDSSVVRGGGVIRGRVNGGDSVYVGGRVNTARIAFNAQNAVVLLTGPNGFEATAFPEVGTGNYSFENLPAGNYTVSILYPKLEAITSAVVVAPNTTSVIEFNGNQPSNVTGIARDITVTGNFPNPATNQVTILAAGLNNPSVSLTSLTGAKFTAPATVTANGVELNLSQLKAGVYMVQIAEGNKLFTTKIVKN